MHNELSNLYNNLPGMWEAIQLYLVAMYNMDLRIVQMFRFSVFLLL